MNKEKALKIAREIDGNTYVDCQELVNDIYNNVNEVIYSDLSKEVKSLHIQLENEEKNNISDYEAKVLIINNLQDELCKSIGKEEHYKIMNGKNLGLGISIGIMIATIIIQITRYF